MSMVEKREHVMNFKVSKEEMEMIRRGAAKEKMTPSEYCRTCVYWDRTIEGDDYAVKMFKENLSNFVKSVPGNIKKIVEELVAPRKDTRRALSHISSAQTKGK
jgi:Mobilization protein NikA